MAEAIKGLIFKPTYEDVIPVATSDGLQNVKFPNRDASFSRNGFLLSQLDGEGQRIMDQQQQTHIKESVKHNLLKQTAATKRVNVSLRNASNAETQTDRINNMLTPTVTQGIGEGNVN